LTFLLVIIYLSFISLGLPDALLGSAWPTMYESLGAGLAGAGLIAMIVSGGTIISSLMSDRVIRRLGTGLVNFISVAMTAAALLGVSFSHSYSELCLWAIPLGLGAGSVDAALNNFVATHYEAKHMSWLHCCWGIGASIGPVIMSLSLAKQSSWSGGFRTVAVIQFALVAVLLVSLPLWKKAKSRAGVGGDTDGRALRLAEIVKLPGAPFAFAAFFFYCSLEASVGLWGSSYLVTVRSIPAETAAGWISLFYLGITLGRFFSGFLSMRLNQRQMIYLGLAIAGAGIITILLALRGLALPAGFFLIGLGCAPFYPSLIHDTPESFGGENSQAVIGVQMASAYVGTTFMPPLLGALAARAGYVIFPYFNILLLAMTFLTVKLLYRRVGGVSEGRES
jgi:fucose permease